MLRDCLLVSGWLLLFLGGLRNVFTVLCVRRCVLQATLAGRDSRRRALTCLTHLSARQRRALSNRQLITVGGRSAHTLRLGPLGALRCARGSRTAASLLSASLAGSARVLVGGALLVT